MYQLSLTEQMAALRKFSSSPSSMAFNRPPATTPPQIQPRIQPQGPRSEPENIEHNITSTQLENVERESLIGHTTSTRTVSNAHTHAMHNVGQSVGQFASRLPKLTLPKFNGDPLQFQTFWDSFEAAVHNNESLTGVQKIHYLRAQLFGDASHVIDNFPLTDVNYHHSVDLLRERFGQPYKLVNARMDALMNLPKPVNNLASLQVFHDKLESHMRALQALGKSPDTYCAMLTPMVLGKLPTDLKKQFARDHNSGEWTIQEVMACILKEIRVLEVGLYSNGFTKDTHSTAASFYTAVGKATGQQGKKEPVCTYCKGSHTANQCTVVKDYQQCMSIVKTEALCFNCLAHHKVSKCTSRRRCKQCNQKHHTSLCPPAAVANNIQSTPAQTTSNIQPPPAQTNNNVPITDTHYYH